MTPQNGKVFHSLNKYEKSLLFGLIYYLYYYRWYQSQVRHQSLAIWPPPLYPTAHSLPLGPKVHSGLSDCTAPPRSSMKTSQTHDQNPQPWTALRVFILLISTAMGQWYNRHFITLWTLHTRFQNQENPEEHWHWPQWWNKQIGSCDHSTVILLITRIK